MSILSETAKGETAIKENYELNLALNTLASIQESSDELSNNFVYEASMLPVFEVFDSNDEQIYCIEADMLKKMVRSKNITVEQGLEELYDYLKYEEGVTEADQIAIAFPKENVNSIHESVTSDPELYQIKCEQVKHHIDIMNCIMNEGFRIVII